MAAAALSRLGDSIELFDDDSLRDAVADMAFEHPAGMDLNEFTNAELDDLKLMRKQAMRLAAGSGLTYPPDAQSLDRLFAQIAANSGPFNGLDSCKTILGVAFGDHLVVSKGYQWTYVEDENGRDLAVERGSMRIFPINAVQKRNTAEEAGFFSVIASRADISIVP